MTRVACVCLSCGKGFDIIPAKAAVGDGKYCSTACRNDSVGYRRQVRAALPGTAEEVAAAASVSIGVARHQLLRMRERKEVRISKIVREQRGSKAQYVPHFELGHTASDEKVPLNTRDAVTHFLKLKLLEAMPGNQTMLWQSTGIGQSTVSRLIPEMHKKGRCHIISWERPKLGSAVPVYAKGRGQDAPCDVVPFTAQERQQRYIKNLKKTGKIKQKRARSAAATRAYYQRKKGDPLVNALFGRNNSLQK